LSKIAEDNFNTKVG